MLLLCTQNIKCQFQGQGSRQIDGVSGTSLGHLERKVDMTVGNANFHRKYVDDIPLVIASSVNAEQPLTKVNNLHPGTELSIGYGQNGPIPFLDILIEI